jgi:hypothetical protein
MTPIGAADGRTPGTAPSRDHHELIMSAAPRTAILSGMKLFCSMAGVVLAFGSASGPAREADPLEALLGDSVSIDGATVQRCADGVCELIRAGEEGDPSAMRDFAFLYFLFVSKRGPRHVTMIERNHALSLIAAHGSRKGLDGVPSALRSLAVRGRLSLFSVRPGRGQRVEVPVSLEDEIRRLEDEIRRYRSPPRRPGGASTSNVRPG